MIESRDAMVSVLGFTGVPGGGWRAASYGCPIRGPFGRVSALRSTPTRPVLAVLALRLRVVERGPSSARGQSTLDLRLRQCSIVGLTPKLSCKGSHKSGAVRRRTPQRLCQFQRHVRHTPFKV